MIIPLIVLVVVFFLIAVRQVGRFRLALWHIMLCGALLVLLLGQITPLSALKAVNLDVLIFLFGMFVVGAALEESGYLASLTQRVLKRRVRSNRQLLLLIIFGGGFAAAFLMNDTVAIIGVPIIFAFSQKMAGCRKVFLLALCFAVTIGSVMSPIGNPQNLLIALQMQEPFVRFLEYLFIPTMLCLFVTYLLFLVVFKNQLVAPFSIPAQRPMKDVSLIRLTRWSLYLCIGMIAAKILFTVAGIPFDFRLTYVALVAAAPLLLSRKGLVLLRKVDWETLVFFAAMFVLMESVWETGSLQALLGNAHADLLSIATIFLISILVSQLISNVPLVALYMPILLAAGAASRELLVLAAGSTIAGGVFILGAASNVIIIQNAEKRGETITFLEFARVGVPLTIICAVVYWLFFSIFP